VGSSGRLVPPSPSPRPAVPAGMEDWAAADDLVSDLRANSSPQLRSGVVGLEPQGAAANMRASLGELGECVDTAAGWVWALGFDRGVDQGVDEGVPMQKPKPSSQPI